MKTFTEVLVWYDTVFKQSQLFLDMADTVENSPWHRESNVGVHTDMVVAEYVNRCYVEDDHSISAVLGLYAAIFHDVGKPAARIKKFKPERGVYYAYPGHEPVSARLFEDYACQHLKNDLNGEDMYEIGWMIEHHLPWEINKADKRRRLALTALNIDINTFVRVLLSDTYGRISDDAEGKRARSDSWAKEFLSFAETVQPTVTPDSAPTLYVPIGPSGCGKSSYLHNLQVINPHINVYSLDLLRLEFYGNDYEAAYKSSVKDKTFDARVKARFYAIAKQSQDLYIDNTNLSAKRRNFYIDHVSKYGYKTVAILMPSSIQTVIDRQAKRGDKNVPEAAVRQHYSSLQLPMFGEFDEVIVLDHNL